MNWSMLGHDWAIDLLKGDISNQRLKHAYLITGPEGIGKRTLALKLAQAINCENLDSINEPCNECFSCKQIARLQHPNLQIVQPEIEGKAFKVDQVRELQRMLALAPHGSGYRVAILQDFQYANQNAQNAFLKTLEEPAPRVIILLIALDQENLLPTIVSRCELIRLKPVTRDILEDWLVSVSKISPEKAQSLTNISGRRPGFAFRLLSESDLWDDRDRHINELIDLLQKGYTERFEFINLIAKDRSTILKNEILNRFEIWISIWRDVLVRQFDLDQHITNADKQALIDQLAEQCSKYDLIQILDTTRSISNQISRNANPRLAAEVLMITLPRLHNLSPVDTLEIQLEEVADAKSE